jgi:polysaccharide export outer membrane protein
MGHRLRLFILCGLCLLAACESAHIGPSTAVRFNAERDAKLAVPATPVVGPTDYRIGSPDVLEIEVFGVTDLTRTVRVSGTGDFTLPLIGRVAAAGKTVAELQADIATQMGDKFIENPQVTVYVKEYLSQRVTVEGAVRTPGIYPLTGRTSLLQVMALSGGLDQYANPAGVVVYRKINDERHAAVFDIRKIRSGVISDPEVFGSDLVVVDYSGVRSMLRDIITASPIAYFIKVL